MKIGIIGAGKHGSRYARHIIEDFPELELAAISRRSPQGIEQAGKWNCRYFSDWRDLVAAKAVDAIISVVPPTLNLDIARACAFAEKALLLEKPLAVERDAGEEIVALFQESRVPLTVAQTLRYNSVIKGLKENIHRPGKLYSFSASHRLEPSTLKWLEDPEKAGAGVILHTAVHMFDALRYITGSDIVRVRASRFQIHNSHLEDLFTAQVEMENGLIGTVDSSKVGKARTGRYEFVGAQGELHADQIHGRLEFIHHGDIESLEHEGLGGTIVPLLEDWIAYIKHGSPNPVPGVEGLAALRACSACLESARKDDWVDIHP
ncbi:MAG: Gfo/Idh/MocA family oxidoreductase [Desulfobulbaceae bacterium]|uniref:Gfo/Idh/MocA family oxidoreductase n=1 Tax=Candidatus Desulfobia pelagia TaxID=2841692 RepID=A0A8J6TCD6_9BACT|nr:Gfo/Idh/MocA family oxidoreductase [Candidatus Desulfobia pelagia]